MEIRHKLRLRKDLPYDLEQEFTAYRDILCIDRIQASAWIGLALAVAMFGMDFYRKEIGVYDANRWYPFLFYFHVVGLLFIIPAIHISRHKSWIIQTRLRRGVVIWGMVLLTITFLLGQAVIVYLDRDSLVLFLGYIFVVSWMFAMSHKERILFFAASFIVMALTIFMVKEGLDMNARITNFIEIFFLSITAFIFDSFDYNLKLSDFLNRRKFEKEQTLVRRLEEYKSRFYTYLTHELRTPLTVISGMANEIAEDPSGWANEGSAVITRNTDILLNLINQILTLSKIQSGTMPLQMESGDVVSFLGYLMDACKGHALLKDIKLHFICSEAELVMDYDAEKYLNIFSNLLSNAIKFTPKGGDVYVHVASITQSGQPWLEITVRDTGIGIPPEELEHIFEQFYQASNEISKAGIGTGIGLSLAYELVKMLHGKISVHSLVDRGTTFILQFPIKNDSPLEMHSSYAGEIKGKAKAFFPEVFTNDIQPKFGPMGDVPEILIVEDNPDVQKYIGICLADLYHLSFSNNGEDGLAMAVEVVPDLVISDVMMPVMDGLTFVKQLKGHPVTSHIPVILLSAKVDTQARIEGLESGADVYMLKPFEKEELRLQIHNLLKERQALQARYRGRSMDIELASTAENQPEDPFVVKVREVVHKHLDEPEFSVVHLCRAVFLSRTQVHKKLKALTGMSATHFMRHIRLSVARELLTNKDKSIAEIAYEVGFSDPNYFTRCYGEEFGESPSETRNG